jgi:hypothetical protein
MMNVVSKPLWEQQIITHLKLGNVEYFNDLHSMVTNDAQFTCQIKSRIAMAKAVFNRKKTFPTSKVDLNLRKK